MTRDGLSFLSILALAGLLAGVWGCDPGPRPPGRDGGTTTDGEIPSGSCTPGSPGVICNGNEAVTCLEDGSEGGRTNCASMGQVCVSGSGCATCRPGSFQCNGNDVEQCNPEGTGWTVTETCDASMGQMCNSVVGMCRSACEEAAESNSYIGCEYWPTPATNAVDESFSFAVVVANPQDVPVDVSVTGGALASPRMVSVPAGGLMPVELPWVDALKSALDESGDRPEPRSVLARGAAYRLVSTLPVTVYQFSPLEFERGGVFSFSNDASLLLPTHVLTSNYIAVSERTRASRCPGGFLTPETFSSVPGFVTIVGASETPVQVTVQFTGHVAPSNDGAVTAGAPGSSQTYTLNQGDVLQLASGDIGETCTPGGTTTGQCGGLSDFTHCTVGDDYDLTGTNITATGPVMVLGGHSCAFLPFNRFACDHIEETIFPLESWGSDFIVSATESLRGEPNIVRIVSGADGNEITFAPSSAHSSVTLDRGEVVEFESREDFRVTGSGPLLVSQFLVGQNYDGSVETEGEGDPAMSLAIPVEQYRSEYTFLAPDTFTSSYVNVVAPEGVEVMLSSNGGAPTAVTGWRSIGGTGYRAAIVEIEGGQHSMSASQPFGVVVYGYASYTSYMYPGGLDFEDINPLI